MFTSHESRRAESGLSPSGACGLWMRSWQGRDSIPKDCGWLWIESIHYPRAPRSVHEAIHASGGQARRYPHASTAVHALSTGFSTSGEISSGARSDAPARNIHMLSTPPTNCPHAYPQRCGRWRDHEASGMSAHLCTQGPSCPQIPACYPRMQRSCGNAVAHGSHPEKPGKSEVARPSMVIHSDCG